MELLRFFPLNKKIIGGQISSLIKTTLKYFVLVILVAIASIIFDMLRLSLIAKIWECAAQIYMSMGIILAVFMYLLQENRDAGGIR